MKTLKSVRIALTFVAAATAAGHLQAQVGINTTTPDSSAVLHIFHDSKGVLLPAVNKTQRYTAVSNGKEVGDGLLIYDKGQKLYYFRDTKNKKWITLNPWRVSDSAGVATDKPWGDVRLAEEYNGRNVYIGADNFGPTSASAKLHVGGTFQADGMVTANNGMSVTGGNLQIGATTITPNSVKSSPGTITATNFVGYGTIPVGGIIMWSGTTIPDGWALCNGNNNTPDLRGRFIVGYNPGDSDYNNPGNRSEKGSAQGQTGGEKTHILTINEMPKHYHGLKMNYGNTRHSDKGTEYEPVRWINKDLSGSDVHWTGTTNDEGGSSAHENRPPYYTLAFIMRIK